LLDVMMPEMDGYETCERIRNGDKNKEVPIIFLTAKTDSESVVKGFELGAQDYITKPFNDSELLARVKTQIELKTSREKLKQVNKWLESEVKKRTIALEKTNAKLQKANRELSVLDEAKTEFLNIISHELRNPLNGIMGALHLIKDQADTKEMINLINVLDDSVNRLEKFTFLALNITSLKTGRYKLKFNNIKLVELMQFSLIDLSEKINEKRIKFDFSNAENDIQINADSELLMVAFSKLFENAIKHSPEESTISISLQEENEQVICVIQDQGAGFSSDILKMKFDAFSTGKEHINLNMGIDLSLVKLILDAHNGEIILENDVRNGAIVTLKFVSTHKS
ncbi:MAG: hybrid sensor histidine kinase/response regulator, partial [Chlorobi bacterium]|nr:hybrid sensor histidine kinase/response regulator [Chlorobiota bacterium]